MLPGRQLVYELASADKTILVLDDVVQTGASLAAAVRFLETEMGVPPDRISTAVLGKMDIAGFEVDYCGFEYRGQVELPWGPVPR